MPGKFRTKGRTAWSDPNRQCAEVDSWPLGEGEALGSVSAPSVRALAFLRRRRVAGHPELPRTRFMLPSLASPSMAYGRLDIPWE